MAVKEYRTQSALTGDERDKERERLVQAHRRLTVDVLDALPTHTVVVTTGEEGAATLRRATSGVWVQSFPVVDVLTSARLAQRHVRSVYVPGAVVA